MIDSKATVAANQEEGNRQLKTYRRSCSGQTVSPDSKIAQTGVHIQLILGDGTPRAQGQLFRERMDLIIAGRRLIDFSELVNSIPIPVVGLTTATLPCA